MTRLPTALEVARWEFGRYFKPRQQMVGLLLTLMGAGVGYGAAALFGGDSDTAARVAVIGADVLTLPARTIDGRVELIRHEPEAAPALAELVGRDQLDGLLRLQTPDSAELLVRVTAGWIGDLEATLSAARQQQAMANAQVTPATLTTLLAPVALGVRYHELGRPPRQRGETLGFVMAIGLMLFGVMTGMGYVFASITGEKQQRVTEQVIAAIPPQSWIDGKILGLAAVSLVTVLNTAVAFGIIIGLFRVLGRTFALPTSFGSPGAVLLIVLFAILGFFFWFAFLAAVASVIDDPHNSSRAQLLFLPILAVAASFYALGSADSAFVRVLALVPPFSASMMPARMILVDVAPWQIVLSLVLLLAAVLGLRRIAGRIFEVGMLMYGKEPTWGEIRRWLRPVGR